MACKKIGLSHFQYFVEIERDVESRWSPLQDPASPAHPAPHGFPCLLFPKNITVISRLLPLSYCFMFNFLKMSLSFNLVSSVFLGPSCWQGHVVGLIKDRWSLFFTKVWSKRGDGRNMHVAKIHWTKHIWGAVQRRLCGSWGLSGAFCSWETLRRLHGKA